MVTERHVSRLLHLVDGKSIPQRGARGDDFHHRVRESNIGLQPQGTEGTLHLHPPAGLRSLHWCPNHPLVGVVWHGGPDLVRPDGRRSFCRCAVVMAKGTQSKAPPETDAGGRSGTRGRPLDQAKPGLIA